jgi:deoxyribose-phosphate aldolase
MSTAGARAAERIDHTLLRADATRADVERLCAEAATYGFGAVCVNPAWVPLCRELLDAEVQLVTVIGFPLGANQTSTKVVEARLAADQGADELDMVAAIGMIKGGEWAAATLDIAAVVSAAAGRLVKVIIESALLTDTEIVRAVAAAREGGAGFVKTSTGTATAGGATTHAVRLMREAAGSTLGVKASGGIRDCRSFLEMLAAGADRIGTSSGPRILECLGRDPRPLESLVAEPTDHRCDAIAIDAR